MIVDRFEWYGLIIHPILRYARYHGKKTSV